MSRLKLIIQGGVIPLRTSSFSRALGVAALALVCAAPALSQSAWAEPAWTVKPQWVSAHEAFLASDAMQGRGSATRDEAIAAAYVGSQFEGFGLQHAPGMTTYLQTAVIIKPRLNGPISLSAGAATVTDGLTLLTSSGKGVSGALQVVTSDDPKTMPVGDVVLVSGKGPASAWLRAASMKGTKLLILRESDETKQLYGILGNRTKMTDYLEGEAPTRPRPNVVVVPAEAFDKLAAQNGVQVALNLPEITFDKAVTTNAVGYLQGSDPKAGTLLYTAHLDHLGVKPDGTIMHGANDDASGTVAVLEIAHAMAAGKQPKRSILFVAYGSEEIGGFGSTYFGKHPPVPLNEVIANIEFEMIGAQDPKLPKDTLMMTGYERSNLGEALKSHGFQVAGDPYPDQHFFERSDNYSLALEGVVAHTVSGWAVTPTYHSPTDDIAHLDLPFMTSAIQSLIVPAEWLANSDFVPQWNAGGKPERK